MAEETTGNEEFEQHSKAFNKALHDQDWITLIAHASWLLENPPENLPEDVSVIGKSVLYENRAKAYIKLGQKQFALDDYQEVLKINSNNPCTHYDISHIHSSFREYEKALTYINQAIELNQNDEGFLTHRGDIYSKLGQYEKAIENYNQAIKLNPLSDSAYNNRGATYTRLNNHEKAINDFTKAIDLNPDNASDYVNRGISFSKSGDVEKALKDFDKALELDPLNLKARHHTALARARLETEHIVQNVKQDYENRLKAVTDPKDIDDRFQERKKEASERLKKLRDESDEISASLKTYIPITWGILLAVIAILQYLYYPSKTWSLPLLLTSVTLTTLFLNFPLLNRLAYLNRNARIERHVLEDYDRKSVMLLIRNLEGENVNTVLKHYKSNGTPEVLNKLYHPKQAYKEADDAASQNLLERIEALLKQIIGKTSS